MTNTLLGSLRERVLDEPSKSWKASRGTLNLVHQHGIGLRPDRPERPTRPDEQITGMSYSLSGAVLAGVLGQIRIRLVDAVADLTAETPPAELPRKDAVDAAVGHHIGSHYITTVQNAAQHVSDDEDRAELLAAVRDLRAATEQKAPDAGDAIKKAGKLRTIAERIGVPAVTAATSGAVETITTVPLSGAFG